MNTSLVHFFISPSNLKVALCYTGNARLTLNCCPEETQYDNQQDAGEEGT